MNPEVAREIVAALASFRAWQQTQEFRRCRLVQYCGPEQNAIDVPLEDVEAQITGLPEEGFYVDWSSHTDCLYLRVWEFGDAEAEGKLVYAESDLPPN